MARMRRKLWRGRTSLENGDPYIIPAERDDDLKSAARKKKSRAAVAPAADKGAKKASRGARANASSPGAKKVAKKKTRNAPSPPTGIEVGVQPDPGRQRRAKAVAKTARIKRSGLESRVLGHVSARGKRAQARRDSRNQKA